MTFHLFPEVIKVVLYSFSNVTFCNIHISFLICCMLYLLVDSKEMTVFAGKKYNFNLVVNDRRKYCYFNFTLPTITLTCLMSAYYEHIVLGNHPKIKHISCVLATA